MLRFYNTHFQVPSIPGYFASTIALSPQRLGKMRRVQSVDRSHLTLLHTMTVDRKKSPLKNPGMRAPVLGFNN